MLECVRPRFSSMWRFVPIRESFVGSEYASVCERERSSVMSRGLREAEEKHLLMLKTTTRNVFTFDKNELKKNEKKKTTVN